LTAEEEGKVVDGRGTRGEGDEGGESGFFLVVGGTTVEVARPVIHRVEYP
jgi:hypothetical protein